MFFCAELNNYRSLVHATVTKKLKICFLKLESRSIHALNGQSNLEKSQKIEIFAVWWLKVVFILFAVSIAGTSRFPKYHSFKKSFLIFRQIFFFEKLFQKIYSLRSNRYWEIPLPILGTLCMLPQNVTKIWHLLKIRKTSKNIVTKMATGGGIK